MISAGEFKNGLTFDMKGNVMQVIGFQHVKPGKGAPFVRAKIKNLKTGVITEGSFNPNEKFEQAHVERKIMQYNYNEEASGVYYFMDLETFEEVGIDSGEIGDGVRFLKEGMEVKILSYRGDIFGVEIPNFVDLKVKETDPGVKGNTAANTMKRAILETGAEIRVPLFVNMGDILKIDTRTGEYIERVKVN